MNTSSKILMLNAQWAWGPCLFLCVHVCGPAGASYHLNQFRWSSSKEVDVNKVLKGSAGQ